MKDTFFSSIVVGLGLGIDVTASYHFPIGAKFFVTTKASRKTSASKHLFLLEKKNKRDGLKLFFILLSIFGQYNISFRDFSLCVLILLVAVT